MAKMAKKAEDLSPLGFGIPLPNSPLVIAGSAAQIVAAKTRGRSNTALFRTFAALEPTESAIAEFRGKLRLSEASGSVFHPDTGQIIFQLRDRPLQDWKDHVVAMKQCLLLWGPVQELNSKACGEYIRWDHEDLQAISVVFDCSPILERDWSSKGLVGCPVIASKSHNPHLLDQWGIGECFGPALSYVCQTITEHLRGRVETQVLAATVRRETGRAASDQIPRLASLYSIPTDLITAIWLQFADTVTGFKQSVRCPQCQGWFAVADAQERNARTDRQYCCHVCKVRAYRGRIENAKRLHASGKTIRHIAKELNSDVETVKGWLSEKR